MKMKVTQLTKWWVSCVAAILLCASVGASAAAAAAAADNNTPANKSDKAVEGKKSNDSSCLPGDYWCQPE